ncbi:glycerol-3-phosphate dehydrogenase/oxidase [Kistimonas scapharcae]|uniref:Glycerol-3-phosphate dehydrogenase/oxidase n=1 Tax=Kistimonas scapharcae TaxID=1036133 RepID=A0ABP8UXY3_9GAMM
MSHVIDTDVTIIGGGIAGLWLFRRLNDMGYKALLLENATLGGGQSIKSQGIIHGGIKYALSGNLTEASECIAGMPARWRACLDGEGEIDLTRVRILSDHQYMWTPGGLGSRMATFFASKALRGRVDPVKRDEVPKVFADPGFKGKLYKLNESVLDIETVVSELIAGLEDRTLKVDWDQDSVIRFGENGDITAIECTAGGETYEIRARRFVLTAGEGTGDILQRWGVTSPEMQLRPLHMVMMKHKHPYPLYAHCISTDIVPRLTVTSHPTDDDQWVWYMGGDIAESGVKRDSDEQIVRAKKEVEKLLPWVDFSDAQWATLRVNRAEPKQSKLLRPDAAYCKAVGNGLITWPTKLALAPNLSDEVVKELQGADIEPSGNEAFGLPESLPRPTVTGPFWSGYFD